MKTHMALLANDSSHQQKCKSMGLSEILVLELLQTIIDLTCQTLRNSHPELKYSTMANHKNGHTSLSYIAKSIINTAATLDVYVLGYLQHSEWKEESR